MAHLSASNGLVSGSNGQPKYLGVTPPIALNGPTPREKEVTESLLEELKAQKTFESESEAKLR